MQFNFPDHTKLVISADGTYLNFTCLSPEAMTHLKAHNDLPFRYIRTRELLSGYTSDLLTIASIDSGIAEANMLREKLALVVKVVGQWVEAGGMGCAPGADVQRMRWNGPMLGEGKKEEWTTVGRFGGDVGAVRT